MQRFFAAANSDMGFAPWFDDIFDPRHLDRSYIIKGGSGTGKSTLMKKAAARVVDAGGECEYFHCSSDPASLDGIIAVCRSGRRFAMIDGTAPHIKDPKYPGAADEIINLGEYWCADILKAQRDEIIKLNDRKSNFYKEAYTHFYSAGVLYRAELNAARGLLLKSKLESAVMRLLTGRMHEMGIKKGKSQRRIRGLSALSCDGEVSFDSFLNVKLVCNVTDVLGTAPFLFDALIEAADMLGLSYDRAPMPLVPAVTEALRFPELSMAVVTRCSADAEKNINMNRFVDRDAASQCERSHRRVIKKSIAELTSHGLEKLSEAKRVHGELEKIYIGAMDFTRLENASSRILERIGI